MRTPTPSSHYDYDCSSVLDRRYAHRSIIRAHIAIYRLTSIVVLSLLPLLAWHNAMTHIVDKYDMPRMWKEDFRERQLSGLRVWVWVFMWICVSTRTIRVANV